MHAFYLLVSFVLMACTPVSNVKLTQKHTPSSFVGRTIVAQEFLLTSYERVGATGPTANIYIEGDGRAWLSKRRPSGDPTPKNPVALKLAAPDPASNVIYLARPCQYTKMVDGSPCDPKYWTSHRFAPEVIEAMNVALDDIKQRHYNIKRFNLIGFSGGGNAAGLLTARRDDVLSLRTIAGNLDHEYQSQIHDVSLMPESLNVKDIASQISDIPQIHFIGEKDEVVPFEVYESYKDSSGETRCIHSQIIDGVGHANGWSEVWSELLSVNFHCR